MVKFRNKLKFSSKGTSDNTGESTIGDSLGSSSGGGDTNPFGSGGAVQQKVGSNTNPFADSSGGSNPFADSGGGRARQQQQRQQKRGSNPFGEDDDDDSEDSDPLSGFSRKRPPTVVHQGTSKSPGSANGGGMGKISRPISAPKPPPSPAMASSSQVRRPSSSSSPGANNPFDDDSVMSPPSKQQQQQRAPPPRAQQQTTRAPSPSLVGRPSPGKTNPFDSPSVGGSVKKKPAPGSNPFGEEDNDDDGGGGRRGGGGRQQQLKQQQQQFGGSMRSRGNNNTGKNPFGEDDDDDDDSNQRSFTKQQRSKSVTKPPSSLSASNNPFGASPDKPERKEMKPTNNNNNSVSNGRPPVASSVPPRRPPPPSTAAVNVGNSNPFDEEGGGNQAVVTKSVPPSVPKPLISQQRSVSTPNATAHLESSDEGMAAAAKRNRWNFGNANRGGGGGDTDSTRPIMSAMDEESIATGVVPAQSKAASSNAAGLASWLRLNKKEDELGEGGGSGGMGGGSGLATSNNHNYASSGVDIPHKKKKPKAKRKKCSVVTPWPFDNFHEVQKQMYEELASRAASDYHTAVEGGYHSGSDDEKEDPLNGGFGGADAKYYERPEELPSIKEAVNDLALVEFEKKAEERAINIVSTWLFDAGLIDELMVNGAISTPVATSKLPTSPGGESTKTSEGVEIGAHGFPLGIDGGAELKMDKETNKLRAMIQRDLSIINARLNDGVAASGLEVQELVNAVGATKDDIGRLRELTTYISDGQISDRDAFLLAKYPYLRKAINARRNINRCFRELEFFSQIPSTCERLRDELHGGEWTEEEWSTIRNVSMEHVELEIMLVEAENSMKGARNFNDDMVDSFLVSHVQNVWELGDEIRMRILSGIGSAFELAINNPAGMVALVEAVEVYERAAESFEKKRKESSEESDRLRFTNMRAAALEQLYQDFEMRGVEMFRGVHEQAADVAEEEDAENTQFNAVLKAATELVTEIDIVKHQMSPCFAPHWHVEALWSSCVAHVCSNHIVQQIGGPDGQNLPELTITQLLELVAWVEYFRETIEETFPEVAAMRDSKKTYFEERPDLFAGDKRTVNMKNATDSLAWVNNMLWEVHRLAQEEFLVRSRSQTDEWLDKVYG